MGPEDKNEVFDCINEAQMVVFHRNLPTDYDLFTLVREISSKLKKPLVFDIDDNLFDLPEYHPDRKSFIYSKALMPMLEATLTADYITVSNRYLQENLNDLNQNITVLPNLLDERIWSFRSPKTQKKEGPLILGYMGGKTHQPDIEIIAPTLFEIKQQFSEEVRFHFYGIRPPEVLLSFSDTIWTPHKTYQYEEFAQNFQQMDVDFFIAPLINNEFNRCKSAIKFLEYSSLGVPGVYSRVYPYEKTITDGKNGLLADSPEEWGEKIRLLIRNPELRHQLALNAQNLIKDKFLMSENSDQWEKTYRGFINRGVSEQEQNNVPQKKIKTITSQLNEYHSGYEEKLQEYATQLNQTKQELINLHNKTSALEQKVENLQKEIIALEQEVLYYALSKSWRVTRPLRMFMKRIKGSKSD